MSLDNIRIVLVSPIYGGNLGSTCRVMANMGLSDLCLVERRLAMNMNDAEMMACHAQHILKDRKEFATMQEAIADCSLVMATTARTGLYRQHAKTPREWAPKILETAKSGKVAVVFGREDDGLTNEELSLCSHIIQIPTTTEYSSLNIAQAVMVCCYEIFVESQTYEPPLEKSDIAPSQTRERMFEMWRKVLLQIGFMEEDKADHMMYGLRRILARGAITLDDVKILMGVARQTEWVANQAEKTINYKKAPKTQEE